MMQVEKPLFSRKKQYFFYNKMLETVETIILYTSVIGVSDVIWRNVYDAVGIDYSSIIVNIHFLKNLVLSGVNNIFDWGIYQIYSTMKPWCWQLDTLGLAYYNRVGLGSSPHCIFHPNT